jgi:hypothetical protein
VSLAWPRRSGALADLVGAPARVRAYLEDRSAVVDERWITRNARWVDSGLADRDAVALRYSWWEATRRLGLGTNVTTPLGGTGIGKVPTVEYIGGRLGEPYLIVRMPPGVVVADLEHVAEDLAESLGVWRLRFSPRSGEFLRVDLIESDPLERVVPYLPAHPAGHLVYGIDEFGRTVSVPFERATHLIAQGATRSGKSAFAYALLGQLAERARVCGDVEVAGIDPTGLLLRPFGDGPRRALGTVDAADRYERALAGVVAEMDRRIATMPPRCDVVPTGPGCPLLFVVLEEWAGVGRILGHKRDRPSATHRHVARLLAEGAKAGIRVVLLVQRAEADVVGAFEREQLLTALTFGAATMDTAKMVHPTAQLSDDVLSAQATAGQGCALLNGPGLPVRRIRAPWIGGYGEFVDAVTGVSAA